MLFRLSNSGVISQNSAHHFHQSPPQIEFPPPPPPPRPQRPTQQLTNHSNNSSTFGTPTFGANVLPNSPSLDHVSTFRSLSNSNEQQSVSSFKPSSFYQQNNVSSFALVSVQKKNAPVLPPPPLRSYQKDDYEQG